MSAYGSDISTVRHRGSLWTKYRPLPGVVRAVVALDAFRHMLYGPDLSYIHHTGFGTFAEQAAPGLVVILRAAGIHNGLIVDLGCGSGIWLAHALRAGYSALGIDVSPAMIELARSVAPQAEFIVGSAHAVEIPTCVAVTALGESISYLPEKWVDLHIQTLINRIADALVPGGLLIFDVVERSWAAPMSYETSRLESDWQIEVEVREDPTRKLLTRTINITRQVGADTRRSTELHRIRTFDRSELEDPLAAAGFVFQVTQGYDAVQFLPHRLGFVAHKTGRSSAQ